MMRFFQRTQSKVIFLLTVAVFVLLISCSQDFKASKTITLLNVSYDPTRELYRAYNELFTKYWLKKTGEKINIKQSHGGSGKQALAVLEGLQADVVTLALSGDIDAINQEQTLINPKWQKLLPYNSAPYTSTIVFLVRKGNPKNIRDWDDLVRPNVQVITPNPKTSGGARWNFLAAWAYAKHKNGGSEEEAQKFVSALYKNTPVLDSGARGATITFTQRKLGDVLITWENEAYLFLQGNDGNEFEIVVPSISILCEPVVALVDSVVDKKHTRKQAQAYLEYLYSDAAQRIIGQSFYRPSNPKIAKEFDHQFPKIKLVRIDDEFGGWNVAQNRFFRDGGVFEKIYEKNND